MCHHCNDSGVIRYGSDTITGTEESVCECRRGHSVAAADRPDCPMVGRSPVRVLEAEPMGVSAMQICFGDRG